MKKFLLFAYIFFLFVFFGVFTHVPIQFGQSYEVQTRAQVGEFYLRVAGSASPYASVVLTTLNGQFLKSTLANSKGLFRLGEILIGRTFRGFCLTTVDFRQLGESKSCSRLTRVQADITRGNLFLAPTLALKKNQVGATELPVGYGYTMPSAAVSLVLGNAPIVTTQADASGYYTFKLSAIKPGSYTVYAKGLLNGQASEIPVNTLLFKKLGISQEIGIWARQWWWIILLTVLPLLIVRFGKRVSKRLLKSLKRIVRFNPDSIGSKEK